MRLCRLREQLDPKSLHTVFCAECTTYFDWKSAGVFHSHRTSGMPGKITRLLACSAEQRRHCREWNGSALLGTALLGSAACPGLLSSAQLASGRPPRSGGASALPGAQARRIIPCRHAATLPQL